MIDRDFQDETGIVFVGPDDEVATSWQLLANLEAVKNFLPQDFYQNVVKERRRLQQDRIRWIYDNDDPANYQLPSHASLNSAGHGNRPNDAGMHFVISEYPVEE